MKKTIFICLFLSAAIFSCRRAKTPQEIMQRDAAELSRQCPISVDSITRLDSLTYHADNNMLTYYYTYSGNLLEDSLMDAVKDTFRIQQNENIRNSVEWRKYKEWDVVFRYYYRSPANGKCILDMKFTPEDYKIKK